MAVGLVAGCLSLLLAAWGATAPGKRLIVRRYRRGRVLRRIFVAVYALLALSLLVDALLLRPDNDYSLEGSYLLTLLVLAGTVVLLLRSRISTSTSPQPQRILAIGAHPDDLELACGASLARLVDAGHQVHGLIMSHGAEGGDASLRPREAEAAAQFLGLASITVHNLPDTELSLTGNQLIGHIEAAIGGIQPTVIFTHSEHDQHQDHYAVHLATLRAARNHHTILCYESPSVTRDFNPGVFLDVEDYTDIKIESVLAHRNQAGKPYMSPGTVTGITRFRGRQAKRTHAEGFEAVRLLVTQAGVL